MYNCKMKQKSAYNSIKKYKILRSKFDKRYKRSLYGKLQNIAKEKDKIFFVCVATPRSLWSLSSWPDIEPSPGSESAES